MAPEFLGLEVVIGRPGASPLRREVEIHGRCDILPGGNPNEWCSRCRGPGRKSAVHDSLLRFDALLVNDGIGLECSAAGRWIVLENDAVAGGWTLPTFGILEVHRPSLRRRYG